MEEMNKIYAQCFDLFLPFKLGFGYCIRKWKMGCLRIEKN